MFLDTEKNVFHKKQFKKVKVISESESEDEIENEQNQLVSTIF